MKLHIFPPSPNARKCMVVNRMLDLGVTEVMVDLMAGDQKTPAFLALNPNGRMPVLEYDDGTTLWESNAIANRLASERETPLWPATEARHDILRWQFWEGCHFTPAAAKFLARHFFGDESIDLDAAGQDFTRLARVLDGHLAGRTWLVGDAMTTADISVAAVLCYRDACAMPVAGHADLLEWMDRIEAMPAWREVNLQPEPA